MTYIICYKIHVFNKTMSKKYNIIYADPPWKYHNKRSGGSMKEQPYSVLSTEDIIKLPISNICEKDCILFLWATNPILPEALTVLKAWGFKYKTCLIWRKIMSLGMGFWFRGQCELLILGIKGKIKAFRCQEENIYQSKVKKHSEKPEYFRGLIEMSTEHIDNRKMIELFARKKYHAGMQPDWN